MATVESQINYPRHTSIWQNVAIELQALIIVQTNIHHRSKVFTTDQARASGNPVIK